MSFQPASWDDRRFLHNDANVALDQNLSPGEVVKVIIYGPDHQSIVATDRRVFIFKKGWRAGAAFGKKLASWDYSNVVGIQIETGMLGGFIAIQVPGAAAADLSFWASNANNDPWKTPNAIPLRGRGNFEHGRQGVALIRQLIAEYQQASRPVVPSIQNASPIAQLKALGELRTAGILTESEFEIKKAALLAQI